MLEEIYKEEESEERSAARRKKSSLPFDSPSRIAVAVLFLLILVGIVLAAALWNDISPERLADKSKFSDSLKEQAFADIAGSTVLENNINAINGGIIYISDTSIIQLNHDCEKVFSEKHSFTNPMIRSSEAYSIAFSEGSGNYRIIHDKHKIHEGIQGSSITDCDITNSGVYGILSDQTGYLSGLTVYDKNNEFTYSYSFSDCYAVSLSLSDDGRNAAVGAINSSNGRLVSKVYLLDMTKNEPIKVLTYEDQLLYQVKFTSEDRVAVVTDILASFIKSDGSKEVVYSYASRLLTAFDVRRDGGAVLSLSKSDDGRSCTVVTLDDEGHEVSSFPTDLKIIALDAYSDRTAVLSYGTLGIYNAYGDSFGTWSIGSDSKSVLLPQSKTAYVLGVSSITKMILN